MNVDHNYSNQDMDRIPKKYYSAYENKRYQWQYAASLTGTPNGNCAHCSLEDELKEAEEDCRYSSHRLCQNTLVQCIFEISEDGASFSVR